MVPANPFIVWADKRWKLISHIFPVSPFLHNDKVYSLSPELSQKEKDFFSFHDCASPVESAAQISSFHPQKKKKLRRKSASEMGQIREIAAIPRAKKKGEAFFLFKSLSLSLSLS